MKNLLLMALIATLTLASCSKEACEKNNTGSLRVNNTDNASGDVYIDNAYRGTVGAVNTLVIDNVPAGNVFVKMETSNYTATVAASIVSCGESVVSN